MTGIITESDCYAYAPGNKGCSVSDSDKSYSYGEGFNSHHGGVYVTEWGDDGIRVWFFQRDRFNDGLQLFGSPDPKRFGLPVAEFGGSDCDWKGHFGVSFHLVFIWFFFFFFFLFCF